MSYYRFPLTLEGFQQLESIRAFENKLREAAKCAGFSHTLYVQTNQRLQLGIVYFSCTFCKECKWSMKYQRAKSNDNSYDPNAPLELAKFNIYHYHTNFRLEDMLNKGRRFEKVAEKDGNQDIILALAEMGYSHTQTCGYVSYLTGLSHLTARFIFYNNETKRLVADFDDDFHEWYQTFKRKNLQIITYPPIDKVFYFPDIIFITCDQIMEEYKWKGHITGIKIIDNKVKQLSATFEKYVCVAFYGYLGRGLHSLFGFAIMTLGKEFYVEVDESDLTQKNTQKGHVKGNKKQLKIYSNLYKILNVFVEVMGPTMKTIIIEDKQRIISVAQYFIYKTNLKRQKSEHIQLIIDPMDTIHRNYPKNLRYLLINLCLSQSAEQWAAYYKRHVAQNPALTLAERELVDQFYEKRQRFMVYNRENPKFVGRWFEQLHYFSYEFIDSRNVFKRSILFLLVYVSNTFIFLKKMYDKKFISMIEHMTVEGILEFDILRQLRLTMYKDGFRLVSEQLFLTNGLNCFPSLAPKEFNSQKMQDEQLKGQSISSQNGHKVEVGERVCQMKMPLSLYYEEMISFHERQESKQHVCDQKAIRKKRIETQQQKQQVKTKKQEGDEVKPGSSNLFARYQELYPLRPPTTVSIAGQPPRSCTYEEGDKFFTCELEATEPVVKYNCDCNLMKFKGIPCRHIIKTCLLYNYPIAHYVSEYWKLKRPYNEWKEYQYMSKGMDKPKRGRPKHSARNRMRQR